MNSALQNKLGDNCAHMSVNKDKDQRQLNKSAIVVIIVIGVIIVGFFAIRNTIKTKNISSGSSYKTVKVERGTLTASVRTNGTLRAYQSIKLYWKTTGTVDDILVTTGDSVKKGELLAKLDQTSLPSFVILAQADLINAQRTLDNLEHSLSPEAQAYKAVEDARQALEDAQFTEDEIALAQANVAQAMKDVEDAQMRLEILRSTPPQSAIEQAYANMLLAEKKLNDTLADIEHYQNKLNRNPKSYMPWESKTMYKKILDGLTILLPQVQLSYNKAKYHYEELQKPPDVIDIAVAEAEVKTAKARLEDAQREYERVKNSPDPADIAILEAKLSDAQREYERVKNGESQDDVAATKARISAAKATLDQAKIFSPISGIITEIYNQPRDKVEPGTPALRIDDLSHLLVDIQVSEVDINKIHVGQDAVLTFDAILAKEYHGVVTEIAMVGTQGMGTTNFKITIEITDPDSDLKPGMTADVDIHTQTLKDVLLIPNHAVRIIENETTIYILGQDGKPKPVRVTLGVSSDTQSEVTSGNIKEDDLVILNPPTTFFTEPRRGPPIRR